MSLQGELVFDQGPHRAQPVFGGHRQPKLEIDFGHLVERARNAAVPSSAALFGTLCSSRRAVIHGHSLPQGEPEEHGGPGELRALRTSAHALAPCDDALEP